VSGKRNRKRGQGQGQIGSHIEAGSRSEITREICSNLNGCHTSIRESVSSLRTISKSLMVVALVFTFGILCFPGDSIDARSQIKAEIESLRQSLQRQSLTDPDLPDVNKMIEDGLKEAADALTSGRVYLSLELVAREWNLYSGARAVVDRKPEVVKGGLPTFEKAWNRTSLRVASLNESVKDADWNLIPLAIRALAESAEGKTQPLLEGSRGFATSTTPKDGLFYLGQAQGEAEFAAFCKRLSVAHRGSPIVLRSMLPELRALQEKTNAAFQPPRSIELHSRFIALNSTIKLADELDASRSYAGSLYQYLEAIRHFGMLSLMSLDAAQQAQLKRAIEALHAKFDASQQDDSIGQLFLQRAEAQVARPDGSAPSIDEWRSAWVIVHEVLPAYAAAKLPASPLRRSSDKTIDITLVRWPYT
jgi:hypothetical protein